MTPEQATIIITTLQEINTHLAAIQFFVILASVLFVFRWGK